MRGKVIADLLSKAGSKFSARNKQISSLSNGLTHSTVSLIVAIPNCKRHGILLAEITVPNVGYDDHTVKVPPVPNVGSRFEDGVRANCKLHISPK